MLEGTMDHFLTIHGPLTDLFHKKTLCIVYAKIGKISEITAKQNLKNFLNHLL